MMRRRDGAGGDGAQGAGALYGPDAELRRAVTADVCNARARLPSCHLFTQATQRVSHSDTLTNVL